MFSFEDASLQITKEEILKYITELQILERYCSNYQSLDSSFKSEFYNDKNASCRIVISTSGIPYYKDYGNGDYLLAFDYVSKKYGSNYHETCNIIANDFGLKRTNLNVTPQLLLTNDTPRPVKVKSNIRVIVKPFSIVDYEYWKQFGISLSTLQFYNVKAVSHVYLIKGEKHYVFEYRTNQPLYSYRFYKNFNEYFKIYNPYSPTKEGKWLSNVGSDCLGGYDQLPESGELLIITKSLKDTMAYYELGYSAVSLQAESNKISKKSWDELSRRFKKIVLNFDDDDAGREATNKFLLDHHINFFFMDGGCKDLSDYIKKYGLKKAEKLIKNKLI